MFAPIQIENFILRFEITFFMAGFAATVAFASAVWYSELEGGADQRFAMLLPFFSVLAAFVSECSLANGILVWPVLSLLAFSLKVSRRTQLVFGLTGFLAIAAYLWGYHSPPGHTAPLTAIHYPLALGKYVVTYLASTWDPGLPNTRPLPSVSEMLTIIAIGAVLVTAFRGFVGRRFHSRFESFLCAELVFVLLTATITAMGRMNFGLAQATASRYQSIALTFWVCFALLLISWCMRSSSPAPWLLQVQVALLILMIASVSRFDSYEQFARDRQALLTRGYAALVNNPSDQESLGLLYPAPQLLPSWYRYMREHKIGPDQLAEGSVQTPATAIEVAATPSLGEARVNGYKLVPSSQCAGFLDAAKPIPGKASLFTITGWAWDRVANKLPTKVIIATSDGNVASDANLGGSRPDVKAALPEVKDMSTGWTGSVQLRAGVSVRAFAVLADRTSACPLMNAFRTP